MAHLQKAFLLSDSTLNTSIVKHILGHYVDKFYKVKYSYFDGNDLCQHTQVKDTFIRSDQKQE